MAEQSEETDLTLSQLLDLNLSNTNKITSADSPNDQSIQDLITHTLSSLHLSISLIQHLAILSPNESLQDLNTRDLRCLLPDALQGQLMLLVRTKGSKERQEWLKKAQTSFRRYIEVIDQYSIIPEPEKKLYQGPAESGDPGRRRDAKIAQFKMERELKNKLELLRQKRSTRRVKIRGSKITSNVEPSSATTSTSTSTSTSAAASNAPQKFQLPYPSSYEDDAYSSSSDTESTDDLRSLYLSLLQSHYLRSFTELNSISMELELLDGMMRMSEIPDERERGVGGAGRGGRREEQGGKGREGEEEDGTWKLDDLKGGGLGGKGKPLLSPEGRVLRPFTILPSSHPSSSNSALSTRLRFASSVFQPSHNLPTMTIDEYLASEQAAGNFLQGGGPRTTEEVEGEREGERAEGEDDTVKGWEEEERGLGEKRRMDDWKDTHRKGEGNMHNRG